jgi:ribosomal protein L20
MPRVKRGVEARARHKKVMDLAKGYRGRRGSVFRIAKEAVMKAGQYAYRDRRTRKRVFRALWIARINAAARECGLTYRHGGIRQVCRTGQGKPACQRGRRGAQVRPASATGTNAYRNEGG